MTVLPQTWIAASLADICERLVDGSHNPPKQANTGRPMLSARNVSESRIVFDHFRLISDADFALEDARTRIGAGDVLVTIVGSIGRTAVVPANAPPFALQRSVAVIKPRIVDAKYVAYALDAPEMQRWLVDNAKGTAQKGVYLGTLGQAKIPLAPPNEQSRIVAKLEELLSDLDAGVAELKAAQKKVVQYRQSLLKAAVEGTLTARWREEQRDKNPSRETGAQLLERILRERRARWEDKQLAKFKEQGKALQKDWHNNYGEPISPDLESLPTLPDDWTWATIDQLSHFVRNGVSATPNASGIGYPVLRINAVRPMSVVLSEVKHVDMAESEVTEYFVESGDLLATRYNGSIELLGVFGRVGTVSARVLHPDKLIRMKPVVSGSLGKWVELAANTGASRSHIVGRAKTTAGQTGISGHDLKRMPIPLPPSEEQSAAIFDIEQCLTSCAERSLEIEAALRRLTAQRQNILHSASSGQLVPQDPNDEPAHVLLERIRAQRAERDATKKPRASKRKATA